MGSKQLAIGKNYINATKQLPTALCLLLTF